MVGVDGLGRVVAALLTSAETAGQRGTAARDGEGDMVRRI